MTETIAALADEIATQFPDPYRYDLFGGYFGYLHQLACWAEEFNAQIENFASVRIDAMKQRVAANVTHRLTS